MFTKGTLLMLMAAVICFTFAACTAAEVAATTGGIVAAASAAVEMAKLCAPLLPPEKAAKLMSLAADVGTDVETMKMVTGTLADAITTVSAGFQQKMDAATSVMQTHATQITSLPTTTEVTAISAGSAAVGGAGVNVHRNITRARAMRSKPAGPATPP